MNLKKLIIKIRSPFYRIGLKNHHFSIISNNCWGGIVSRNRNIPYYSPTVGLFIFSKDYIKFLSNLKYYLSIDMVQLSIYDSKYSSYLLRQYDDSLVIGKLDDIELIMVHYSTFDEAKEKWNKRKIRVDFNNLLIKYSDQNLFEADDFNKFKELNYNNKLFITIDNSYTSPFTCVLEDKWNKGYAVDDIKSSFKVINVNKLLNNLTKK